MTQISSSKQYTFSSRYITLKAKRIQPEDGLKKRAEICSCVTYCITQYNKFCCVLTASYIYCIQSIEHNEELTPKFSAINSHVFSSSIPTRLCLRTQITVGRFFSELFSIQLEGFEFLHGNLLVDFCTKVSTGNNAVCLQCGHICKSKNVSDITLLRYAITQLPWPDP